MSAEPEFERYLVINEASDNSTQGSSKECYNRLIKTANCFYADYKENRTSIVFQAKERNPRRFFKPQSHDFELRTTGGLEEKLKKSNTPRNAFNKSKTF